MLVKKLDLRPAIALSRCGRARSSIRKGKSRITRGESIATGSFFENRIVASENWMPIKIPLPELQIEFSVALAEIRRLYLHDALQDTWIFLHLISRSGNLYQGIRLIPGP